MGVLGASKILFKDSNVCILFQSIFDDQKFREEFSKVTREGYELKTTVMPKGEFLFGNNTISLIHYFQKLGKSRDNSVNPVSSIVSTNEDHTQAIPEMRNCPKCKIAGYGKWCSSCGTLTKV